MHLQHFYSLVCGIDKLDTHAPNMRETLLNEGQISKIKLGEPFEVLASNMTKESGPDGGWYRRLEEQRD